MFLVAIVLARPPSRLDGIVVMDGFISLVKAARRRRGGTGPRDDCCYCLLGMGPALDDLAVDPLVG